MKEKNLLILIKEYYVSFLSNFFYNRKNKLLAVSIKDSDLNVFNQDNVIFFTFFTKIIE
jgi:hypothetical protein